MENILLVETGPREFKTSYLKRMLSSPFTIHLLKNSSTRCEDNWHTEFIDDERVINTNFLDREQTIADIKSYLKLNGIDLSGVTTYQEEAVPITQHIAKAFHLPEICDGEASHLRNKILMRKILTEHNIPQPKFVTCNDIDDIKTAIDLIGRPCVIKPSEMLASIGVHKIEIMTSDDEIYKVYYDAMNCDIPEEDLKHAFNISSSILIEEYIESYQEISVEGFISHGKPCIVAMTKKYLGMEPHFDEIGHEIPFETDAETRTQIEETIYGATSTLKMLNTAYHAELRLRKNKPPVLIEIAARLAGDAIPLLVELSTGMNFIETSLLVAAGRPVAFKPDCDRKSCITFVVDEPSQYFIRRNRHWLSQERTVHDFKIYEKASEGRYGHIIWCSKESAGTSINGCIY